MPNRAALRIACAAMVLAGLFFAPSYLSKSQLYSLTDVAILGMFAVSYNLLLGHSGLLSFGHSAYFGLGAYATALVLVHVAAMPLAVAILLGALAGALGGIAIGCICVRRSGPYFSMLTLAFGMLLYVIAWKWRGLTQGDDGFGAFLPREAYFPLLGIIKNGNPEQLYYVVVGIVVLVVAVVWALMTLTPYGNAVVSVRQNEERASFLGYNVFVIKLVNYTISAGIAGLAGALFAVFHDFVSTHVIGIELSTDVVMMTFIGGSSWFFGPILGAGFFVVFGDVVSTITARWQMIMGVIFVAMVLYAPRGFSGMVEAALAFARRRLTQARKAETEAGRYGAIEKDLAP